MRLDAKNQASLMLAAGRMAAPNVCPARPPCALRPVPCSVIETHQEDKMYD